MDTIPYFGSSSWTQCNLLEKQHSWHLMLHLPPFWSLIWHAFDVLLVEWQYLNECPLTITRVSLHILATFVIRGGLVPIDTFPTFLLLLFPTYHLTFFPWPFNKIREKSMTLNSKRKVWGSKLDRTCSSSSDWWWFSTETGYWFLPLSVVVVRCRRLQDLLVLCHIG